MKYNDIIVYLDKDGFKCVSTNRSTIKIFTHPDGTTVKLENSNL